MILKVYVTLYRLKKHFKSGSGETFLEDPRVLKHENIIQRGEERAVKFLFSLFFSLFFSLLPNFFCRFSLLPDFSPFSLISLLRGLFYLLLHRSASFPHVLKEGKHTKHVCHVVISRSSHTTFRFCHVSLKL